MKLQHIQALELNNTVLPLYINNKHEKKLSIIEIYHGKQFTNKQHKIDCSDKGLIFFGSCFLT